MMRNPKSSSAPVITGPGGDYRRPQWPMEWANRETLTALFISFFTLVGFSYLFLYDPTFLFGLVAGLSVICVTGRKA